MLARLLRYLVAAQALLGAVLAWQAYHQPAAAVAGAVLLPFAILLLVDTFSALVSRAPQEPWGAWLRSVAGEYLAGWQVFLLRQPWTWQAPGVLPATGGTPQIPVVLVHGYLCNHRIWNEMADALRARGHAVFAVNLEPVFTSIDNYAPVVEAAVAALCAHSGSHKVALVGHSMGGLAIRTWMRAHGTARVARVVTLGTPHAGTLLAKATHTPNGKQMAWRSPWLEALAASESPATRALLRIALTPQDNIVFPQRAQVLEGVVPQVFDGLGHVQLCLDSAVVAWTVAQLADL